VRRRRERRGGTGRIESQLRARWSKPHKQKADGGRLGERWVGATHAEEMGRRASGAAHARERD
jgi:hypothetical protein